MSREELAEKVGRTKSAISGIENGHHRPSLELAERLAHALGRELAEVFSLCKCECRDDCDELLVDMPRLGSSARFAPGHNSREPGRGALIAAAHRARRHRLGIAEAKVCKRCGRVFTRSEVPNQSLAHWLARDYCSHECGHGPRVRLRHCDQCAKLYRPHDNGPHRRFCSRRCAQLERWRRLTDIPRTVLEALPPGARQRWIGRLEGRRFGRLGGRPPVRLSDEQLARVKRLRASGWGRRAIATHLGVSERAVRNAL